jgi:hypothetical protein
MKFIIYIYCTRFKHTFYIYIFLILSQLLNLYTHTHIFLIHFNEGTFINRWFKNIYFKKKHTHTQILSKQ